MNPLLRFLARALEPSERDAVLGDLAESGASPIRNAFDLLGLILRRQALLWTHWQPWIALIGVVGLSGMSLSSLALGVVAQMLRQVYAWQHNGVPWNTALGLAANARLLALGGLVFCCSAVDIYVFRRLSARAAWILYLAFILVSFGPLWAVLVSSLPETAKLSFLAISVLRLLPIGAALNGRWNIKRISRATVVFTGSALILSFPGYSQLNLLVTCLLVAWPVILIWSDAPGDDCLKPK